MLKNEEEEYKCAYKEVVEILEIFSDEIGELIPREKIDFYRENMNENHQFTYDYTREIAEQNILYQTRCILANLFRDYIANEEDRARILLEEREEIRLEEEKKKERYNLYRNSLKEYELRKENVPSMDAEKTGQLIETNEKMSLFNKIKKKIHIFIKKCFKNEK